YRLTVPFFGVDIPLLFDAFLLMLLVRFLFGMGEAGAYPNIARAFYHWFPFTERGSAQGAGWMAGRLAAGLTPLVGGALFIGTVGADGHEIVHWRHTFWIFGIIGALWCVAFAWWFRDRPEQKAGVNRAEIDLIRGNEGPPQAGHAHVPWRHLPASFNL